MPTKRRSSGGDGPGLSKVPRGGTAHMKVETSDDVKGLVQEVVRTRQLLQSTDPEKEALLQTVMDRYNEITADRDVADFLMKEYPDVEKRLLFSVWMDAALPADDNVTYLKPDDLAGTGPEKGMVWLRPWMLCFHRQAGNKGLLVNQVVGFLIQLIIVKGFLTDAATVEGVWN